MRTSEQIKGKVKHFAKMNHLDRPDERTAVAIEEGRRIARDPRVKAYGTMEELKNALDDKE